MQINNNNLIGKVEPMVPSNVLGDEIKVKRSSTGTSASGWNSVAGQGKCYAYALAPNSPNSALVQRRRQMLSKVKSSVLWQLGVLCWCVLCVKAKTSVCMQELFQHRTAD